MLPKTIEGTFWIKDFDINGNKSNLISIEAENNKWKIVNNNESYTVDIEDNKIDNVTLELNKFYTIYNTTTKTKLKFYTSSIELNNTSYSINNSIVNKITIGKNESNNIIYNTLEDITLTLTLVENDVIVNISNEINTPIYKNNSRINSNTKLNN